jgi:hypothetical protein
LLEVVVDAEEGADDVDADDAGVGSAVELVEGDPGGG